MNRTLSREAVSKALLPILLHEVRGATQLLVGLRAILEIPGGDELFTKRSADLAETSNRLDELGFALAVLSTATGANMLMSRRDPRSAIILWNLAKHAARQPVGDSARLFEVRCEGTPPLIAPSALDGWQVAFTAASLVIASFDVAGGFEWRWTATNELTGTATQPVTEGGAASIGEEALERMRERVPGSRLEATDALGVRWTLPMEWIQGEP